MSGYRIPEIAKQYTNYDMIMNHTSLPDIPEIRTRVLFAFLEQDEGIGASSELYTLVSSLLQMGMDTHDTVSIHNDNKEKTASLERQLRVLAGDYFSSRFYQLLSNSGDIELIKLLSGGTCEVNRSKMMLYMKMKNGRLTAAEYLQLSVQVRSQLLLSFNSLLTGRNQILWPGLVQLVTSCEVILEELFRLDSIQDFHEGYGYWHIIHKGSREDRKGLQNKDWDFTKLRAMVHKYRLTSMLNEQFESNYEALCTKVHDCLPDTLAAGLLQIVEPFRRYVAKSQVLNEI
ncbi:heptaprenyl diphosphate synthase [Paenibacillus albiflavus]|uniref:Heptaprenyl diphosphate synthase n=1 Tax=Paenibacillus albiflavus TaxID=2545760 RepID=A0A4R4EN58_9BACL|nr:heptaprenyl diphosphate synthase component 1 [Paenibacillus albiflavus]TCZ81317.1 heptaprenyl diphosphate synthase [Paenibacillus albiflavus]